MPTYEVTKGTVGLGQVLEVGQEVQCTAAQAAYLVGARRLKLIAEDPEPEADEPAEEEDPKPERRSREKATKQDREQAVDE